MTHSIKRRADNKKAGESKTHLLFVDDILVWVYPLESPGAPAAKNFSLLTRISLC